MRLYSLFLSIISISNPQKVIQGDVPKGRFYNGDLFNFKLIDNFCNFPIKSELTLDKFISELPKDDTEVIKELALEKFKLVYIRDVKIRRVSQCIKLTFSWIVLGLCVWTLYLFKVGL